MKIKITYTEIQRFENTIEVEMTSKEYKEYLKLDLSEQVNKYDLCSRTSIEHHISTEYDSIETETITTK